MATTRYSRRLERATILNVRDRKMTFIRQTRRHWSCSILSSIHHKVWECACGSGELSKWLESRGHGVLSSDLVDRGYGTYGIDFLKVEKDNEVLNKWANGETFDILTNPPYKYAADFILHALGLIPDDGRVIMFLKTTFLEGKQRKKLIYDINPPRYVFQHSERILCAKNGDFDYMRRHGGSAVAYCFMIFQKKQ